MSDSDDRRIRICHVITNLSVGGAQETVLALARGIQADHDVTVVAGPSERSWVSDALAGVDVRVVNVPSLVRPIRPLADVRALFSLWRTFKRLSPDVVHTHSSKAGVLGRIAAIAARVPVRVHTIHGWSFHQYQPAVVQKGYRLLERVLAYRTSRLVAVSRPDIDKGIAAGIGRPETYVLIRSGIDLSRFQSAEREKARANIGVPAHAPIVGTVGRLSVQKDPLTLLHAFAGLHARDALLVFVGDGPLRAETESAAVRAGVADRVRFMGARDDVAGLLPGFDVFALSSRWEGLPRVVLEAMASGVPVVATDVDGVPEVVEDGVTGRSVKPGDVDALCAALDELLADAQLRDKFAVAAGSRLEQFSEHLMVEETAALYRTLIGA